MSDRRSRGDSVQENKLTGLGAPPFPVGVGLAENRTHRWPVLFPAYLALTASTKVQPGESVLVHGAAGGVGSLAVQIAKVLGAGQVIATAGSEERRAYTLSIGADVAVDYAKPDWPNAVLEATRGRGQKEAVRSDEKALGGKEGKGFLSRLD